MIESQTYQNGNLKEFMDNKSTPSSDLYDLTYYRDNCGGHQEFNETMGEVIPPWMVKALSLANLKPSDQVLDLGSGRGEVLYNVAKVGCTAIGIDYAFTAVKISQDIKAKAAQEGHPFEVIQGDARQLPFEHNYFDVVFMLDVVEHLSQKDLKEVLIQVRKCLNPSGRLIIHTMPNMNYYKYGYPVYRFLNRLMGKRLPKDARDRFYHGHVHVNIQTPKSLRGNLEEAQFTDITVKLDQLSGSKMKKWLCRLPLLKSILANDILAVAKSGAAV